MFTVYPSPSLSQVKIVLRTTDLSEEKLYSMVTVCSALGFGKLLEPPRGNPPSERYRKIERPNSV